MAELKVSVVSVMPGEFHGYLTKQSEHIKAWRKFWFVLNGHNLYWFKANDAKEAKGMIELETHAAIEEATVKSKTYAFSVTSRGKTSAIVAASPQEMEQWVHALRAAVATRKNRERESQERNNSLVNVMVAFDLSTDLARLSIAPRTPPPSDRSNYLSERQEGRLKKMLIESSLENELVFFRNVPNLDKLQSTHYLRVMFDVFIVKCPVFKSQPPMFWTSLNQLMNNLPQLSRVEQRGEKSKRDQLFRKLQKLGVMFFYSAVRTSSEAKAGKLIELGYDTPDAPKVQAVATAYVDKSSGDAQQAELRTTKTKREEFLENESKNFYTMLKDLVARLVVPGELQEFLHLLRSNKTYHTLPNHYCHIFEKTRDFVCLLAEGALQNDARYARLKKMHDTIPFNALPAILALTNPMKLLSGLLGLGLAKPLGAKNLLQRLVKIMTLNPLDAEVSRLKKLIKTPAIYAKVDAYIEAMFQDTTLLQQLAMNSVDPRTNVNKILSTQSVQPVIPDEIINGLSDEDVAVIFSLVQHRVKIRDTKIVVEALGDDQLISLIKELFPVLQAPLMELFAQGNISALISQFLKFFQKIVRIAEAKRKVGHTGATPTQGWFSAFRGAAQPPVQTVDPTKSHSTVELNFDEPAAEIKPEDIGKEYILAVSEFIEQFYSFLHRLAANDKGLLRDLLQWLLEIFNFVQQGAFSIDLHVLYLKLSPEQRTTLVNEVNAFDRFRASKFEKRNRKISTMLNRDNVVLEKIKSPKLTLIPSLRDEFHALLLEGLKSEFARQVTQSTSTTTKIYV
eukprot:TRINITY_DN583_c0_g1_i1.p1 TRINITY_DN583_c0_g1~~TRINITY_DN583_c0_g1_i1.p1  ORF type:complete len:832 (-),score=252.69 TRINITY_DN583_c0_g1_i1:235-2610(-)